MAKRGFAFAFDAGDGDAAPAPAAAPEQALLLEYSAPWPPPLALEPGLAPLCFPLAPAAFLRDVAGRRVFVSHAPASASGAAAAARVAELRRDLHDLSLPALLAEAPRIVAWLRDKHSGRMSFVDVPDPVVAAALHGAGHSLYFNPRVATQRRWVAPLCADLGFDFASALDGGFGGDIEVFAVAGQHSTPWHFDAQENFTVQLSGRKRWTVMRSGARGAAGGSGGAGRGLSDPVTNLHPATTNARSLAADRAAHLTYAPLSSQAAPTEPSPPGSETFELRAGSVMYLPAGCWHRVDCEDAAGSLSANFSVSGGRWSDFVGRRLLQLLWADPAARARIVVPMGVPEAARAHLAGILQRLLSPAALAGLGGGGMIAAPSAAAAAAAAAAWLPAGIFDGSRRVVLRLYGAGDAGGGLPMARRGVKRAKVGSTATEARAEDEDDEEGGGASAEADAEDLLLEGGADEDEDDDEGTGEGVVPSPREYSRGALSVLALAPDVPGGSSASSASAPALPSAQPPTFHVHAGLGCFLGGGGEGGAGFARPDFSVRVRCRLTRPELSPSLTRVLGALAALPPGGTISQARLLALATSAEGAVLGPQSVRMLIRLLLHVGFLIAPHKSSAHAAPAAGQRKVDEEAAGGQSRA